MKTVPDDTFTTADGDIAGGILIHVGGGVHVVAVLVGDGETSQSQPFLLHRTQAQGIAANEAAAEEHERITALAEQWIHNHARYVEEDFGIFELGDIVIARSNITAKDMLVRWMVRGKQVFVLPTPVHLNPSSEELSHVSVVPALAPGGSGDSADLAMFCGTIASSLSLDVQMAITGDISPTGQVLASGALAEKMRTVIEFNMPHMLIPAAHGHPPGRRSGIQLWCARQAHDGVCSMLDAVSLDPPEDEMPQQSGSSDGYIWVILAVALFISWIL